MSRDFRDQRGGHRGHWAINSKNHAEFARQCRRSARAKAKHALRKGEEPEPRYAVETLYYD